MKIYDWKTLLGAVIICGGVIVYKIISFTNFFDLLSIALFAYLLPQCLRVSLIKSEYEAEQARIQEARKLRHKTVEKYGKGINYLLYSPFIVLGLGAITAIILAYASPYKALASMIFSISCIIFVFLLLTVRSLQKKIEKE